MGMPNYAQVIVPAESSQVLQAPVLYRILPKHDSDKDSQPE